MLKVKAIKKQIKTIDILRISFLWQKVKRNNLKLKKNISKDQENYKFY